MTDADTSPRSWEDMTSWLVESIHDKPVGFVLDLGPQSYVQHDDDDDEQVVCAQIQMLEDGVLMLRRSRSVLEQLLLTDYHVDDEDLDRWYFEEHFEDCTDGYLFTRDVELVAGACTAWFRASTDAATTDELGCTWKFPDVLGPARSGNRRP